MAKKVSVLKKTEINKKPLVPEKYQDIISILFIVFSVYIFFWSAISGGGFGASDTLASLSFETYLKNAAESGEFPQWIPNIFGGMPAYSSMLITGERSWDMLPLLVFGFAGFIGDLLGSDIGRVVFYYGIYGIGVYLFMRSKNKVAFISLFTALAAVYSTSVIIWPMIGHNTKPVVLAFLPFVFLFVEKIRERFSLTYTVLLAFTLHLMLEGAHVQMIFYSACALGIYLVFEFSSRLIKKENPKGVLVATGILIVAAGLAFLMSSDRYLAADDYTPYSTRGSAPIMQSDVDKVKSSDGGNTYEYATMWSFVPQDMKTFIVPNFYGFGKLEYNPSDYDHKILPQALRNKTMKLPTYWSDKTSEDAPAYMGILVFLLAIVGFIYYRKDVFVMFLGALSLFALILSFGNTIPFLYDLFFNFVPFFNKFRAPSMVLILLQFAFPILAGYGLSAILDWRKNRSVVPNKLLYFYVGGSVFVLLSALIYTLLFSESYMLELQSSDGFKKILYMFGGLPQQYMGTFSSEFADFIYSKMISDWFRVGFIALLSAGLVWFFVKEKIRKDIFLFGFIILLLVDLMPVGRRAYEAKEKDNTKQTFIAYDWIKFLQKDNEKFRIYDEGLFQSPNEAAYFGLESVNGYHSAKMRIYQDLLDVGSRGSTSNMNNAFLWNLLNVKYVIMGREVDGLELAFKSANTPVHIYFNPSYLKRAYFTNRYEVEDAESIVSKYSSGRVVFNPKDVAFLEEKLDKEITPIDSTNVVEILEYKNEYIKLRGKANGDNLLVLSEIYYPNGWKAYIDGVETKIYKTNFAFRSIVVPKGEHEIEFKFTVEQFEFGRLASILTNIILILALIVGILIDYRKGREIEIING